MTKYPFHAILEYGLGDYDDTVYEYEVTDEQLALIRAAVEQKKCFDETGELSDLYHELFELVFHAEKKRYMDKILSYESDHELVAGEDYIPFEEHCLYLAF